MRTGRDQDSQSGRRPRSVTVVVASALTAVFALGLLITATTDVSASGAAGAVHDLPIAKVVESSMTAWKAAVLGIVEGLTEYLPISSTGHLLIASGLMGLGGSEAEVKAMNTYAIAIQFGAILAVAGLFWKRFQQMLLGLIGRSDEGRHLLIVLIVAFAPAAVLGFLFDDMIESALFSAW
ncbi:MAG: hypothetical protein KDB26_13595, partial [Microthrixaceae bacterium]|nr:hypothetical protein [Microthrixaceae bacterium]